jgi:hypothetical protein
MPVILTTQEIRRMVVQSQAREIVHQTISQKNPTQKSSASVVQGIDPEFKSQYHEKKN